MNLSPTIPRTALGLRLRLQSKTAWPRRRAIGARRLSETFSIAVRRQAATGARTPGQTGRKHGRERRAAGALGHSGRAKRRSQHGPRGRPHRIGGRAHLRGRECQRGWFAKKAVVSFKMPRSALVLASSRRSLDTSASSGRCSPRPGNACPAFSAGFLIHWRRTLVSGKTGAAQRASALDWDCTPEGASVVRKRQGSGAPDIRLCVI